MKVDFYSNFIAYEIDVFLGLNIDGRCGRASFDGNIDSSLDREFIDIPLTCSEIGRISFCIDAGGISLIRFQQLEVVVVSVIEIVPSQLYIGHRVVICRIGKKPGIIAFIVFVVSCNPGLKTFNHIVGSIDTTIGTRNNGGRVGLFEVQIIDIVGIEEEVVVDVKLRTHSHIVSYIDHAESSISYIRPGYYHSIVFECHISVGSACFIGNIVHRKDRFQVRQVIEGIIAEYHLDGYLTKVDARPTVARSHVIVVNTTATHLEIVDGTHGFVISVFVFCRHRTVEGTGIIGEITVAENQ